MLDYTSIPEVLGRADKLVAQMDRPRKEFKSKNPDSRTETPKPSFTKTSSSKPHSHPKENRKTDRKPFPPRKPAKAHQLEPFPEESSEEEGSDTESNTSTDSVTNNLVEIFHLDGDEWS